MTTKHQPATPLPWENGKHVSGVFAHDGMKLVAIAPHDNTDRERKQDAAYIAHAANAYPRLVAALRLIAAPYERADGKEFDRAQELTRALLRELGEE